MEGRGRGLRKVGAGAEEGRGRGLRKVGAGG